ncbi:M20/M25/M40 family metallo-hydrolase [bacterium]|nr:M20/M25/M40 family metallo-hydrolase [bacterium]
MEKYQLLEQLCLARGVAGQEGSVRQILREALTDQVDSLETDALGNLIARKRAHGEDNPLRMMIAAHMDEVGFMVVKVNDNGTLKVRSVGGIDARLLPGKRVQIGEKALPGVILQTPVHLQGSGNGVTSIDKLVIDTGGANGIKPGDMVTFEPSYGQVGRLLKAKSFDDRVGCYVLVELLKRDYPCEVVGVFTVQEEIGLRGARVAAYAVDPHIGFALEGTIADDTPKDKDESPTTQLGKGPALSVMDHSAHADPRLVRHLIRTAEDNGIPWQFKQPGVGGTDIGAIHLAREGIPSMAVSVPCRYIHAPAALLDPQDLENTIELMAKAMNDLRFAIDDLRLSG